MGAAENFARFGGSIAQAEPQYTVPQASKNFARFGGVAGIEDTDTGYDTAQAGFLDKIAESFTRGQKSALADVAIYDAFYSDGDVEGVYNIRKKLQAKQALNPIEGNKLSSFLYSNARTAGQMFESVKRGGKGALIGAGVGLATSLLAGGPTGEEGIAAVTGAKIGAKVGGSVGAASFSYRQGWGAMYADMLDRGVDPDIAQTVSSYAAIPYAAIEFLQLKTLSPAIKEGMQGIVNKTAQNVLKKAVTTYGKRLGAEVLEEMGQEVIEIAAVDIARYLDGQGVKVDANYLKEKSLQIAMVGLESAKSMALLPIPGVVVDASLQHSANQAAVDVELARLEAAGLDVPGRDTTQIGLKPEDVSDPVSQLQIAVDNAISTSTKTIAEQTKIRKLEKGARLGEAEAAAEATTAGVGDWKSAMKAELRGEYTKLGIEPLQEVIPVESYNLLDQGLRVTDKVSRIEAMNLGDALKALYEDGKPFRDFETRLARQVWGDRLADSLQDLSEVIKGKEINWSDYISVPKAIMASGDISRTLRQNILMIGKPKLWSRALARDITLFAKNERAAKFVENMALKENAEIIQKSGIRINKWGPEATAKTSAEHFPSKVARRYPGIARSERAYVVGGNMLRIDYIRRIADNYRKADKVLTDKQWKDIGHIADILTGEGDSRVLGKYAPAINAIAFAPRLLEARIRAFTDLFNPKLSWVARKSLAYHTISFVGFNFAMLSALSMVPGVNVEWDRKSTDFLKLKIGNTRVDFWGGYLPLARTVIRLWDREIKTQSGATIPLETYEIVTNFLQSKLGPVPGYVLDLLKGETYIGHEVSLEADSLTEQFYQRFTPLFIQDIVDGMRYQGYTTGAVAGGLAFFGASVVSYPKSKSAEVSYKKDMIAMQVLGKGWDELGPEVQDYLKEGFPEIDALERQASFDRQNNDFLQKIADERRRTTERMTKQLPQDVQEEFNSLQIRPLGISSRIGTDWYLNDTRKKQYEMNVTKLYKKVLPKLIRSSKWDRMPPAIKIEILGKVMTELKDYVRKDMIQRANLEDIKHIAEYKRR